MHGDLHPPHEKTCSENYTNIRNALRYRWGPGQLSRYSDSLQVGRSGDRMPVGAVIFCTRPHQPWSPTTIVYNRYGVISRAKSGQGVALNTTPYNAEVQEREELYLYSPSVPLWPVIAWTLYFFNIIQTEIRRHEDKRQSAALLVASTRANGRNGSAHIAEPEKRRGSRMRIAGNPISTLPCNASPFQALTTAPGWRRRTAQSATFLTVSRQHRPDRR